jgi:hypothetical protein
LLVKHHYDSQSFEFTVNEALYDIEKNEHNVTESRKNLSGWTVMKPCLVGIPREYTGLASALTVISGNDSGIYLSSVGDVYFQNNTTEHPGSPA